MINTNDLNKSKISVLISEYERRRQANARYSWRAFARDLGISHTLLSLITSSKRALSIELIKKLMTTAKLPKAEQDILALGLPADEPTTREKLSLEKFAMMADWVHYAILSLIDLEDFTADAKWIAARLNITELKAETALRRLLKLKVIELGDDQKYRQAVSPIVIENAKSTEATRSFNDQLIKKATHSMHNDPFDTRDLSSMVFLLDQKFLPYAVERIRNFRRSLSNELEKLGTQKEVYALAVQLFPLSKKADQK